MGLSFRLGARISSAIGAVLMAPSFVSAQAPPSGQPSGPRWEVEALGGVSFGRFQSGGQTRLPEAGAPIVTSSPIFPSWHVPSWFFGDGAAFLNNVAAEFGMSDRLTPLDAVLEPAGLSDAGFGVVGVRVRRMLRPRYWLEFGADVLSNPIDLSSALRAGLDDTTRSFTATFRELLATGPFTSPTVDASYASAGGASREVSVTVAAIGETRSWAGLRPFVVVGGGLVAPIGDLPEAELVGRYRFQIAGSVPVDETDRAALRYRQRTAFVAALGGGVRRDVSSRWGFSIDGRVLIGPNTTTLVIDARPVVAAGTPAGFIESFTYPNLQFSNNPSTGRESTLGGPGLSDFEVFEGGWLTRGRLTIGVYVRVGG